MCNIFRKQIANLKRNFNLITINSIFDLDNTKLEYAQFTHFE